MYNDSRYGLTRYSANREAASVAVSVSFAESLGLVAGAAIHVEFRERYAEALQGYAQGTVSIITGLDGQSNLAAAVVMSADVIAGAALTEDMLGVVSGQKNTPAALTSEDALAAKVFGAKAIPARLSLADRFSAVVAGSKDIHAALNVSEALTAMLEATSRTTERAVFQLTIPPGGELRIDSGLYTVLLDGENVLYAQAGDWVSVSRDLLRVTIESASGGPLSGQLIYTERYL